MAGERIVAARNDKAMTVGQLIAVLSELDPDLKVWADGCDCTNPVTGIDLTFSSRATLEVTT